MHHPTRGRHLYFTLLGSSVAIIISHVRYSSTHYNFLLSAAMSVSTFNDFKSLEEAREALITDYDRQRAELRQRSMAIKRELLRKTGQAKALRALRKHTKEVTRRLKKDLKEKLAAADLWAFEDPNCELPRPTIGLMNRSRRGQRLPSSREGGYRRLQRRCRD